MIVEEVKSEAIAKLELGIAPDTVAEALNIPKKLVREWHAKLSPESMVRMHANIAVSTGMINGDIAKPVDEQQLKTKLERTAEETVDQISLTIATGDIVRAKALSLCSDSICKLYLTFVAKGMLTPGDSPAGGETFRRLMRD